jgi:hypothetical protein
MEPEFAGLLIPLMWLEFAEEAALAAGDAWRESATAFADIGRAQALVMTDSLGHLLTLAADAADAMMASRPH